MCARRISAWRRELEQPRGGKAAMQRSEGAVLNAMISHAAAVIEQDNSNSSVRFEQGRSAAPDRLSFATSWHLQFA